MITFCEKCREMVPYKTRKVAREQDLKGKKYHFVAIEPYCPVCNSLLFVHELRDENLKSLEEVH